MFDIGFLELLICGVIALLVLGPERLPTAARAAGRWVGKTRRMVGQFTSELDRQLKADELREELRKAGDIGLDDVQKNVRGALDEAKRYEHMILPDDKAKRPAPATRRQAPPRTTEAGAADTAQASPVQAEKTEPPVAQPSTPTSQDKPPENHS